MILKDLQDSHFRYPGGVGYSLELYRRGGTVTPISSWADADQAAENPWPVVLADDGSGDGVALIYVEEDATLRLLDTEDAVVDGFPCDWVRLTIEGEFGDALARIDTLEDDVSVLQTTAQGLLDLVDTLDDRMDAAEADIDALQSTVSDHGDTLIDHAEELVALDGRADTLESRADAVEDRATALEGRATSLESRATAVEGRATDLEDTVADHADQIADLQAADVSLDSRIDDLETGAYVPPTITSGKYYHAPTGLLIQWGSTTANSSGLATVTFGTAYDATPVVLVAPVWASSPFAGVKISNWSASSFSILAGTIDADGHHPTTITVPWVAFGVKA